MSLGPGIYLEAVTKVVFGSGRLQEMREGKFQIKFSANCNCLILFFMNLITRSGNLHFFEHFHSTPLSIQALSLSRYGIFSGEFDVNI